MKAHAPDSLHARLLREHGATRGALVLRHALRAAAGGALALALAVLAGVAWPGGSTWAIARSGLAVLGALAALGWALSRLRREWPALGPWLEALEAHFPGLRSWLRNALDFEAAPGEHTSPELAAALRAEAARRLADTPIDAVRPRVHPRAPLAVLAGTLLALTLAAAWLPQPALRAWRTLWDPALAAPPVTLAVEPGSVTLAPGATLAVRARVRGSASAPRLLGEGASPAPLLEAVEGGVHRWRFDLPPVTRARDYAVRVGFVRSPRYRIALAGQPQPVSFAFEYVSPAYARLPVQTGSSTSGDVSALRGSIARIEVTFDRDLESLVARLPGGATSRWSAITPRRWRGTVPVAQDGEWSLAARSANGEGTWRWRVSALADAPPVITVAEPRGDQDLPSGSRVPFDVLLQDDLGLTDLRLQYRKEASQPWTDVPLSAFAQEPREARVSADWDAGPLSLLPGESGSFRFVVRDNDRIGGRGVAASAEFRLRFPTMAELYQNLDHRQDAVQQSLQRVAEQAHELQKTLDQLQRQQPRPGVNAPPQYQRDEEMRKALERQQEMSQQLDHAADQTRQSLADAAERQAFRGELQQKLGEMADLVRQIQSPEFRDAMQRMREALERMDRSTLERTLPQVREQNRTLMQNLERSLALLRQMRDEERMQALARRAEELKSQQDALNREHEAQGQKPGERDAAQRRQDLAARQREAEQQSQQLARETREAANQTESQAAQQDLRDAAEQLEQQAAAEQEAAAQQAESSQPQQASRSGQQASQHLAQAGQRMNRSSQAAQQERDARQLAAVRRSAQDLVSLGREAAQNMQQGSPDEQAGRQTDLSEGVARVSDSLDALGRETPVLTPQVQQALGRAMRSLSNSGREMAQGNASRGQQEGRSAQQSLAEAVQGLRSAESSMCDNPGSKPGAKPGQTPGERMDMLGGRQQQLNERSHALAERLSRAMRLSSGDRAQLRELADEQARIRAELEDIQRQDEATHELLGHMDPVRREMQQVEEQLRQDAPPGEDVEQHQNHILSRMLDATRSLNRRDFDPQREARAGQDVPRPTPAPLPASLLRENDRLRLDLMKADADRYPAQYRALIERYLRRLNGSPR